jgi:2-alkyl-3-oxoalkanoate reductase
VRALVTGASGFLGRHLCADLLGRGDEVVALVRPSRTPPRELEGADLLRGDLRVPGAVRPENLHGIDVIYHLAASLVPPWRAMFEANVAATELLLESIATAGWRGRFVHVSTFAVYGFNQLEPGSVVDEHTPLEPDPGRRDDYAWTKLLQEEIVVRFAREHGVELVIVRPGTVYGPGRAWQHRVGRQLSERVVLLLGGSNRLPLTYVENAASLLAAAGHSPDAPGQAFNAIDPDPPTQKQYLALWRRAQSGSTIVIPFPLALLRLAGKAYSAAEQRTRGRVAPPALLRPYVITPTMRPFEFAPSAATRVMGWTPPVAFDEAMARTLGG